MKNNTKHKLSKEYWLSIGLTGVAAFATYLSLVRPWHLKWGATDEEAGERLPGDELVPHPKAIATHAITIEAPVRDVWAWLVQMGQDKGGFYSYAWLENMVGCHMRNAEQILPEFQHLNVGDKVLLHPQAPPLPVEICEPYKAIVLGSNTRNPGTWGFYLKELDASTTRLIIRGRSSWKPPSIVNWLGHYVLLEPAHFIMERKMMLGIKERAERDIHKDREAVVRADQTANVAA